MYLYFWFILQNSTEVWAGFTYRKLKIIRGKKKQKNSGGLCEFHMLSHTSNNVNLEIQQASMLCKSIMSSHICCTKVCLNGHSNMLELVQRGFLPWGMQKNLSHTYFAYGQWSRKFWDISKGEWCGALFYSQCNKLETAMQFGSYCSCQKKNI